MGIGKNSLSSASITKDLGTRFVGQRIIYHPQLTSTMEVAKREARLGAAEGTVVVAGEQTGGRGRMGRLWLSPKGNIALSIILYPGLVYLPSLIMLASLAAVHSIEAVTGLKAQIGWPNDVLIKYRKVCGILVESDVWGETVAYAVIGIGMNANLRTADFPEISSTATSLSEEVGGEVSLAGMIRQLLVDIEELYLDLQAGGSVYHKWRDSLVTLGKKVRASSGGASYEGIAESVDRDGSLLLRRSDGSLIKVIAADVTLHS